MAKEINFMKNLNEMWEHLAQCGMYKNVFTAFEEYVKNIDTYMTEQNGESPETTKLLSKIKVFDLDSRKWL